MSLEVSVAGLRLKHPIMNASGILGNSPEGIISLVRLGFSAIVTKSITPKPLKGFKPPIIMELPTGGLINAVGLANPGKSIIKDLIGVGKELGASVIVNVAGSGPEEFAEVTVEAEERGADAVELNLSCPHREGYGLDLGSQPSIVHKVVKDVTSVAKIPVIAKLGLSDRVTESAGKALEAGAKALTLINTIRALYIDIYTLKPVLTAVYGGLSGPPIHPVAVRVVYDVYKEYGAEIIGSGGVQDWQTAAELIAAGAKAIQIGTALAKNQEIVYEVIKGLEKWIRLHKAKTIKELVGAALKS